MVGKIALVVVLGSLLGTASSGPATAGEWSSYPDWLTDMEGTLYLTADDGTHGEELWKSDGTEAGTVMVKDSLPGSTGIAPRYLTDVGGTLFFRASDGSNRTELWKSDGTEAGTLLVRDINPGIGSSYPSDLTNVDGTVFFIAEDGTHGEELWKSDGTEAGTVMVKDIRPGPSDADLDYLTAVEGMLFFTADDGANGEEPWRSDGTEAGTVLVKDIHPGSVGSYPGPFIDWNGTVFFGAIYLVTDPPYIHGGLWKSDGTEAGTVLVTELAVGPVVVVDETLFLVGDVVPPLFAPPVYGTELWKSDGTEAGTVLVKDIRPGPDGSSPSFVTDVNGTLFFTANDGIHGRELWKSDGTEAGTVLVKDIYPGSAFGSPAPEELTNVDGTLFLVVEQQLWKSDGTEAGTVLVKDLDLGFGSEVEHLTNMGGTLFFSAYHGLAGQELWKSDGTETGTVLVKDIHPSGCPPPDIPCREPIVASKALLVLGDYESNDDMARDKIIWKWKRGEKTDLADFGDPLTTDDYTLCLYETFGDVPKLRLNSNAPAGGECAGRDCWRALGSRGYFYKDKDRTPGGLDKIRLKPGDDKRASILVKGKGRYLDNFNGSVSLGLPVTALLNAGNGECWKAEYFSVGVKRSTGRVFKAVAGSPCGAFIDLMSGVFD